MNAIPDTNSTSSDPRCVVAERASLFANRLSRQTRLHSELQNNLRDVFAPRPQAPTRNDSELSGLCRAILKLVSPLLHHDVEKSHRVVDHSEPIAIGLERSLQQIWQQSHWHEHEMRKPMALYVLAPLYLATGTGRLGTSLVESLILAREHSLLTELDFQLGDTFSQWFSEILPAAIEPNHAIAGGLSISWRQISEAFWQSPSPSVEAGVDRNHYLDGHSLTDTRRAAYWSITKQWLSGQDHIIIPSELSLGVVPWPALRTHWSQIERYLKSDAMPGQTISQQSSHKHSSSETSESGSTDSTSYSESRAGSEFHAEKLMATCEHLVTVSLEDNDPENCQVIEIRSSSDPELVQSLDQQLTRCRANKGLIALVVMREIHGKISQRQSGLTLWQKSVLRHLRRHADSTELRGFVTEDGELAVMLSDIERPIAAQLVRDAIQIASVAHIPTNGLVSKKKIDLVSGIGSVSSPARSFRIEQLTQAAWRCLDGASAQGAGVVKTIEAY